MMTPQHRSITSLEPETMSVKFRPIGGPIAILPAMNNRFAAAILSAGGEVAELSDATRGIVCLASSGSEALTAALTRYPGIEWVQLPWAGVDAFADVLERFRGTGRRLWTSAKGAYAQPVAEHALALTLALLREFPKRVMATSWSVEPEGRSLFGLSVVIVGAGGIALELIRLMQPFGVRVTVVRRKLVGVPTAQLTVTTAQLDEVLPDADVLILAAAATVETADLIDAKQLALMKPSAILINIARGNLVNTTALTAAIYDGRLAGAGLDVTAPEPLPDGHPLWNHPQVIITPHSADTPQMTAPLLAERISVNVKAMLENGNFVGIVDLNSGY